MTSPILRADIRVSPLQSPARIRGEGFIPGIIYGKGIANVPVKIKSDVFDKVFREAGENTLVQLEIDNRDKRTVLIHDVTFDPIKGTPLHIDFYQVRLDEKVKTEVPLVFTGTSQAVKDLGGTLVKQMHSFQIEALPQDIPHEIEVDVSRISTFEDRISVKDVRVASSVKVLADEDEIVALVEPPRTEEELAELETTIQEDVEQVEGVKEEVAAISEEGSVPKEKKRENLEKKEEKKESTESQN